MRPKKEKQKAIKKAEKQPFLKRHLYEVIIFVFSFLLFANSISKNYNMDDEMVTINHRLTSKGISAIPEIFTSSYYEDNMGYAYEYRPVVLSSFAIEHQLFGDNPRISHFFNVLLYALCCLLLFRVLTNISNAFTPLFSFIVTLLFAAHSSHTEVVCSIKNRDEILSLIFCLFAFLIALRAVQKSRLILLLLLPPVFALAFMTKITFLPFAVIIPMALILFTQVNFITLILVIIAPILPAFFLISTGNFADKVFICAGLVAAPLLLYFLLRFRNVSQLLKKPETGISGSIQSDSDDAGFEGFKGFFKNLAPPSSYFSFYPIAAAVLPSVVYVTGIIYDLPVLEIIAFPILFILVWRGNEKWSWWANVMIYLCLTLTIFRWDSNLFNNLVNISLCYQVFFGTRKLRAPAAFTLLISIALNAYFLHSLEPIVYAVIFAGLRTRAKWIFVIFGVLLSVMRLLTSRHSLTVPLVKTSLYWGSVWAGDAFNLLVLVPLIASILLRKGSAYIVWACRLMAFLLFISYQVTTDYSSRPVKLRNRIEMIGKDAPANVISKKQDRPILFLEQPVSPNDSWKIRTGTSMRVLFHYFIKTIVPYPLAFYYGYKFIAPEEITKPIPMLSVLIHLLLLLAALYFLKRNPVVSFGIGIYLISIITFANYFVPIPGIVGDRYLLVPSLGWSILLTILLFKIWKINAAAPDLRFSQIPKGFKYTLGFVLCFYSAITFSRNFQWKDNLTLFRHDISYVDQSAISHNILAIHLMKNSETEQSPVRQTELRNEALGHFKRAQEIYPGFLNVAYDIGRVYLSLNMTDSAIAAFKHAVKIDSTFSAVHKNLAELLFSKGRYDEAIPNFEYLIKANPSEFYYYNKLSSIYFQRNEFEKSIAINTRAMRELPNSPDPVFNIGKAYLEMKQPDSARHYFLKVNEISPGDPLVQQLLQQIGNP